MGNKRNFLPVVFLAVVLGAIAFVLIDSRFGLISRYAEYRLKQQQNAEAEKTKPIYAEPYNGEMSIKVNPITSLNGMTTDQIAEFRIEKVDEYAKLNLFPLNYQPFQFPHVRIYGTITSGENWLHPAQFYISNPYLLIILTSAGHVTPLLDVIQKPEIKYSWVGTHALIEETYAGDDARRWFQRLYSYTDHPGVIRVWMVNAFDAGFLVVYVDVEKSVNLDASWNRAPKNITNSVYSNSGFFHVGGKGVNNLSPEDERAWIKLMKPYAFTRVYVKLWRAMPESKEKKEDMAYLIRIEP